MLYWVVVAGTATLLPTGRLCRRMTRKWMSQETGKHWLACCVLMTKVLWLMVPAWSCLPACLLLLLVASSIAAFLKSFSSERNGGARMGHNNQIWLVNNTSEETLSSVRGRRVVEGGWEWGCLDHISTMISPSMPPACPIPFSSSCGEIAGHVLHMSRAELRDSITQEQSYQSGQGSPSITAVVAEESLGMIWKWKRCPILKWCSLHSISLVPSRCFTYIDDFMMEVSSVEDKYKSRIHHSRLKSGLEREM